jgi:CheY-like chemotaxis protein
MKADEIRERFLEALDVVQALLELITKREQEINSLYERIEALEANMTKRDKEVALLKWHGKDKSGEGGQAAKKDAQADTNGHGGVVLIDPILPMRHTMREILNGAGISVLGEATNLSDALALVKNLNPDIVILSARLDDVTGLTALKEMREIVPGLKAILVTDTPDVKEVLSALKYGAVDVLAKPVNRLRLIGMVKSLLTQIDG